MELPKDSKFENWDEVGTYFNYNGIIGVKKNASKGNLIFISFSGNSLEHLLDLKNFLKYGTVTKRADARTSFKFRTNDRKQILDFLLNVSPYSPLRKETIDFLISGYCWFDGKLNGDFNFGELDRLNEKWKLLVRKEELEKERDKIRNAKVSEEPEQPEEAPIESSEELEGGEDGIPI